MRTQAPGPMPIPIARVARRGREGRLARVISTGTTDAYRPPRWTAIRRARAQRWVYLVIGFAIGYGIGRYGTP